MRRGTETNPRHHAIAESRVVTGPTSNIAAYSPDLSAETAPGNTGGPRTHVSARPAATPSYPSGRRAPSREVAGRRERPRPCRGGRVASRLRPAHRSGWLAPRGRTRKSPGSRGNRGPGRSASATLGYPARGPGAACALEVPTRTPPPQNRCHSRPRDHLLRGASHPCVGSQPGRPPIRPASTGDRRAIARVNTDPIVGQAAFPCQIAARCGPSPRWPPRVELPARLAPAESPPPARLGAAGRAPGRRRACRMVAGRRPMARRMAP